MVWIVDYALIEQGKEDYQINVDTKYRFTL